MKAFSCRLFSSFHISSLNLSFSWKMLFFIPFFFLLKFFFYQWDFGPSLTWIHLCNSCVFIKVIEDKIYFLYFFSSFLYIFFSLLIFYEVTKMWKFISLLCWFWGFLMRIGLDIIWFIFYVFTFFSCCFAIQAIKHLLLVGVCLEEIGVY